ncbi:MAG TPA: hypothetical protein VM901_04340 [Bdellovibrionota bacterium]|jgi:hypothetical protein|nr:hypothetical protein [Bdellovibrionota bacterium]
MINFSPKVAKHIYQAIAEQVGDQVKHKASVLRNIKRCQLHEGDKIGVVYADGTESISNVKSIEASAVLEQSGTPDQSLTKVIDELSSQLAEDQTKAFIGVLQKTIEKSGNSVKGEGPTTAVKVLKMLDMIEIDFENGLPQLPEVMANPKDIEAIAKAILEMMTTEPYKTQYESLINVKMKEFNEREASRKLVD